ncbi:hypothetical protein [Billgrantia gudaonensis]|uniref:Uncharacterized protein n=1 Tax=Billgrantia gudaonensis TaxID=376427 RepID=A0A1G9AU25_9GAMM|nr:hypothetical protein [Halomonas gudaonensis]SDK30802.1 hypothetical protein SAMN04487954_11492 [Halomonas gudaonensis]
MSRKPVHLKAPGPKGDRQAMWEAIRALHADGQDITVRDVWLVISHDAPKGRVRDYLMGLEKAGYLKRSDAPRVSGTYVHYTLVRDIGVEAPRVRRDGSEPMAGRGREQLWRTLKIIGEFTAAQLADAASTPAVPIAEHTARDYCYFLRDAGYLSVTREASPGVPERYRLMPSRWTGPLAPMIQRTKQLYDPNTGEVVYTRVTQTEGGEP